MSKIHDVLAELRHAAGVRGAAVVTADGLVAAESLATGLSADVIAGLSSYLMMTTNRCLVEGGYAQGCRLTLNATHGKAVFVALHESFLVVVLDQFAEVEQAEPAIDTAVAQIQRVARLS
jgi:predicted regulator of Ras-like GTPase activity (Roadblock/LC7/MglB family)